MNTRSLSRPRGIRKLTFEVWMKQVDCILVQKLGLDSGCLPDIAYLQMFTDGKSASSAASAAIKAAKE
jgi:hypothetical protein